MLNAVESQGGCSQTSKFRNFNNFINKGPSLGNGLGANKLTRKITAKSLSQDNVSPLRKAMVKR